MIAGQFLDPRFLIFRYAGDDQVLVGGDTEFTFVNLRDLQQASF